MGVFLLVFSSQPCQLLTLIGNRFRNTNMFPLTFVTFHSPVSQVANISFLSNVTYSFLVIWYKLLNTACKHNLVTNTLFCWKAICKSIFKAPKRTIAPVSCRGPGSRMAGDGSKDRSPGRALCISAFSLNTTKLHKCWRFAGSIICERDGLVPQK